MTLDKAIEVLLALKAAHGNVELYFDCPYCGKSTSPNKIVATATMRNDAKAHA